MLLSPLLPPLLAAQKPKHLSMQEHCLGGSLKANLKATAHMQTKAKTTRKVRVMIAVVIVLCISASSLILRILWKSTYQASNILSQSTSSHVSVRRTQLPLCFTSTMSWLPSFLSSTAKSTKGGWHITNAPFISTIFWDFTAPPPPPFSPQGKIFLQNTCFFHSGKRVKTGSEHFAAHVIWASKCPSERPSPIGCFLNGHVSHNNRVPYPL
jgi:hypothetical protein